MNSYYVKKEGNMYAVKHRGHADVVYCLRRYRAEEVKRMYNQKDKTTREMIKILQKAIKGRFENVKKDKD